MTNDDAEPWMPRTREEAIAAAGRALADATEHLLTRDPHEAALAAYVPGGPSVEELEVRIRAWQQERGR